MIGINKSGGCFSRVPYLCVLVSFSSVMLVSIGIGSSSSSSCSSGNTVCVYKYNVSDGVALAFVSVIVS